MKLLVPVTIPSMNQSQIRSSSKNGKCLRLGSYQKRPNQVTQPIPG